MAKELLNPLFTKLGLSSTDVDAIFEGSVSDELKGRLNSVINSTTTIEAAKSNQSIRNHIMALTLQGLDDSVLGFAKNNYGETLGEDFFTNLSGEKKSSTKVIKLLQALTDAHSGELTALKEASKGKGAKASEEAQKRIEELIKEVRTKDETIAGWETKFNTREKEFHQTRVKGAILRHLAGINWRDKSPAMVDLFTQKIINDATGQAGFTFDDKDNMSVHSKGDPSVKIYGEDKTRELSVKDYILTLAKDFMAKNDAGGGGGGNNSHLPSTKTIDTSNMTSLQRASFEHQQKKLRALKGK